MKKKLLVLLLVVLSIFAFVSCKEEVEEKDGAAIYTKNGRILVEFDKEQKTETRSFTYGDKTIVSYEVCTSASPVIEPFASVLRIVEDYIDPLTLVAVDDSKKLFEPAVTVTEGGLFRFVEALLGQVFDILPDDIYLALGGSFSIEKEGEKFFITIPSNTDMSESVLSMLSGLTIGTTPINLGSLKDWKADALLSPIYITDDVLGLASAFTNGSNNLFGFGSRSYSLFQTIKVVYNNGKSAVEKFFPMTPLDETTIAAFGNVPVYKDNKAKLSDYYTLSTGTDWWELCECEASPTDLIRVNTASDTDFFTGHGIFVIKDDPEIHYYILDENQNTFKMVELERNPIYVTLYDYNNFMGFKNNDKNVANAFDYVELTGEFTNDRAIVGKGDSINSNSHILFIVARKDGCLPNYYYWLDILTPPEKQ